MCYLCAEIEKQRNMNETIRNIISRRSVKSYTDEMPPMDMIRQICQAGTYAPTGMGAQSPIILAVTDKAMRDRLSRINLDIVTGHQLTTTSGHSDPFYGAPVVLVVLAEKERATRVYDGSLVMANLMLAAHSLGLGACWIHRAKETFETQEGTDILRELGIEGEYEGIGNCIIGYEKQPPKEQKPRKENYIRYV